jgi:hypothetical protein
LLILCIEKLDALHLISSSLDLYVLTLRNGNSMIAPVRSNFRRFPSASRQQFRIFQAEDLDLQRTAALDHFFLAVLAKAP